MSTPRLLIAVGAALLAGCNLAPHQDAGTSALAPQAVPVDALWNASNCQLSTHAPARYFADAQSLQLAEPALAAELPPAPAASAFLLVDMGRQSTGGYRLRAAETAALEDSRLSLVVERVEPAPGSITTQALSRPCLVLRLPADLPADTGQLLAEDGSPWARFQMD